MYMHIYIFTIQSIPPSSFGTRTTNPTIYSQLFYSLTIIPDFSPT